MAGNFTLARAHTVPERRIRRLIGIVALGQMLAHSRTAVIKDASNIEIRVGTRGMRVCRVISTP